MQTKQPWKYLNYLKDVFREDYMKFYMVKTMVSCFQPFQYWGVRLNAPLGITVKTKNQLKRIVDELAGFNPNDIVSLGELPKEFSKVLQDNTWDILFVQYTKGANAKKNLEKLTEYCSVQGEKIIVLLFIGCVPKEALETVPYSVSFNVDHTVPKLLNDTLWLIEMHEFIKDYSEYVRLDYEKLRSSMLASSEPIPDDLYILILAFALMYELHCYWLREEDNDLMRDSKNAVDKLLKELNDDTSTEEAAEWFREALWNAANLVSAIYDVESECIEKITLDNNYVVLFNSKFYTLSEKFFTKVCESLTDIANIPEIKEKLWDAKILVREGQNRTYWTKKITIRITNGSRERVHRICIDRSFIDGDNPITWAESIKIQGGESDEGIETEAGLQSGYGKLFESRCIEECFSFSVDRKNE